MIGVIAWMKLKRTLEVDVDDGIPLLLSHFQHQSIFGDAGVVDKNVDMTEVLVNLVDKSLLSQRSRQHCRSSPGLHALSGNLALGLQTSVLLVDDKVSEGDVGTLRQQISAQWLFLFHVRHL